MKAAVCNTNALRPREAKMYDAGRVGGQPLRLGMLLTEGSNIP